MCQLYNDTCVMTIYDVMLLHVLVMKCLANEMTIVFMPQFWKFCSTAKHKNNNHRNSNNKLVGITSEKGLR